MLRGQVEAGQRALRDRDDVIDALRARLAVAQAARQDAEAAASLAAGRASASGAAAGTGAGARDVGELVAANGRLTARVKELEAQLGRQREELGAMRRLALEVQVR